MKKVITALLIVVAIAFAHTLITQRMEKNRAHSVMSNGRNLYLMLTLNENDIRLPTFSRLPITSSHTRYSTSTDFFRSIVTNPQFNLSYGFFAAPGITVANSADSFSSSNNAWCIVADIASGDPANTPILFTRNILIDSLDDTPQWDESTPLDMEYAVVITLSGAGIVVEKNGVEMLFSQLNKSNLVMRP